MTEDQRQCIVRRFIEEGWNGGSGTPVGDIVADAYESNDGGFFVFSGDSRGPHRRRGADAVTTVWAPTGTTRDQTFTDRGGHERPFELKDVGVSRTVVVDGKVTRHDLFWARDPLFP